jgi:predicted esterase
VVTACVCLGLGYDLPRITGGGDLPRLEFPEPMVVNPPGNAAPTAAVIFLHGLGGHAEGTDGVGIAANLIKLPGVKWVFPDAPTMPVTVEGGKNIPSVRLF